MLVSQATPDQALEEVLSAALEKRPLSVSALAVHGVMTGVMNDEHRARLNELDMVVADGQPVRWAMNLLYRARLRNRVYGPALMRDLCAAAADRNLSVYLYGSTKDTLEALENNLRRANPGLVIAGSSQSKFRDISDDEQTNIAEEIRSSGASMIFVGLGCPRQEVFVHRMTQVVGLPMIAVGAAFDYHAGKLSEPPRWIQDAGLQWLYRLISNPRRLWKRYLLLNPAYVACVTAQLLRVWRPNPITSKNGGGRTVAEIPG